MMAIDISKLEWQAAQYACEMVTLQMKRPITEEIVMLVGDMDGFKNLEISNDEWIAFIANDRLQNFYETPDFAVEIVSPSQYHRETVEKANLYMKDKTKEVWLAFQKKQEIEVHTPNKFPVVYVLDDTLVYGNFLSKFMLEVKSIFEN